MNRAAISITVLLVATSSANAAIDCEPLRPKGGIDERVENSFKAEVDALLKSLARGDIEDQYKRTETDVLKKYPNADRLHVWDSAIYMLCTLLASSSENDQEKFNQFQWLIGKYEEGPPPSDGGRPPPESPRPQSDELYAGDDCSKPPGTTTCCCFVPFHIHDLGQIFPAGTKVRIQWQAGTPGGSCPGGNAIFSVSTHMLSWDQIGRAPIAPRQGFSDEIHREEVASPMEFRYVKVEIPNCYNDYSSAEVNWSPKKN